MLLKLTAAEQKKLQAIRDSYQPERERLAKAFQAADNDKTRQDIGRQQRAVIDGMQMEIDAFLDKAQRKRFKKIEAEGVQAIIDNAKEQAPGILKDIYRITQRNYRDIKPETLEEIGVGSVKDGAFLLKANYAAQALRDEFYLHIEALQDNREALQSLMESIITSAEQSPLTDGEKATKQPLVKIDKFGMMRDNLAARLLQDADLFSDAELNGQFMMQWKVNEGEEDGIKLVAKVALIYEDPEDAKITYKKRRLTFTDKGLYELVGSLFNYQLMVRPGELFTFSPWQIAKLNLGQANNQKSPSKNQIKTAERCIDKWLATNTIIDITDEVTRKRIDGYVAKNGIMEAKLLKADKYTIIDNKDQEHVYYEMRAVKENEPILYKYNKAKGHILEVPYYLLDVSEYVRIDTYTITFRNYLLLRIALMYQKKGLNSNRILFSTLYDYTKVPTPEDPEGRTKDLKDIKEMIEAKDKKNEKQAEEKKEEKKEYAKNTRQTIIRRYRQRDKEQIFGILQCWTDKGWINGFTPVKKGQTVIGVDIMLNPANRQKD